MSVGARLDRWWYTAAPAERLAALRALVGGYALVYLLVRAPSLTAVARFSAAEFEPVGVVRLLAAPLAPLLVYGAWGVAILSGGAFVAGFCYRWSGPLFALSFLWVTSYRSSWGMIFHTENLPALHLLLLAAAPAAHVLSIDARSARLAHDGRMSEPASRSAPAGTRADSGRFGWAIRAICAVTTVTYVLAGIAKLRLAGPEWLDGELLRAHVAYDNLRKIELGSLYSPLGAWLAKYAWPFHALAWMSLLLELGAPLALLHARLARLWIFGVFGFHVGVLALMAIAFPYQLSFVAYLSFFPLERLVERARRTLARFATAKS